MKVGLQKTSLIDYPGKVACVIFLPGCNLRCPFCHNPGLVEPERFPGTSESFIDLEDAYAYVEKRKKVLQAVVISGGEPCLHGELPEIVRFVHSSGLLAKVDTNGLLPEKIGGLGADFVAMDLKTSFTRYREIPGAGKDAAAKLRESIRILRENSIDREFRTTLAPRIAKPEDVLSIAETLEDGEEYVLQRFRPGITLDTGYRDEKPTSEEEGGALLDAVKRVHARTRLR